MSSLFKTVTFVFTFLTIVFTFFACSDNGDSRTNNATDVTGSWDVISVSNGSTTTTITVSNEDNDSLTLLILSGTSFGDTTTAFDVNSGDSLEIIYFRETIDILGTVYTNRSSSSKNEGSSSSVFSSSSGDEYISSSSQKDPNDFLNESIKYGTMTDSRDNQTYKTVKIGEQTWMAQNLNYDGGINWPSDYSCGKYYQWTTAVGLDSSYNDYSYRGTVSLISEVNHQGICPDGWHIPSIMEWKVLFKYVKENQGNENIGKVLKAKNNEAWPKLSEDNKPTDDYGFSVVYGSYISYAGSHVKYNEYGHTETMFWTSLPDGPFTEYASDVSFDSTNEVSFNANWRNAGEYVRCIQDRDMDEGASPAPKKSSVYDSLACTLTDLRDNQAYKTTVIGTQVWMAENLNYVTENGYADDMEQSRCYNDYEYNCNTYGRLYRWTAAMDIPSIYAKEQFTDTAMYQGICPQGWHLPSREDFIVLVASTGDTNSAGLNLKAQESWDYGAHVTDEYSFLALAVPNYDNRSTDEIGDYTCFWSTNNNDTTAFNLYISDHNYISSRSYSSKYNFQPIRCLRNKPGTYASHAEYGSFKDSRNEKTYKTVKIGDDTWMAENLNYTNNTSLLTDSSWCYDNKEENCSTYGRLYSWNAATDHGSSKQGVCPKDWHLSTKSDWDNLSLTIGSVPSLGQALKSTELWTLGAGKKNDYGFSAIPAGYFDTTFQELGTVAEFWTRENYNDSLAFYYSISGSTESLGKYAKKSIVGRSIRCVQDR